MKGEKRVLTVTFLCGLFCLLVSSAQADPVLQYGPDGGVIGIKNLEVGTDLYDVLFSFDTAINIWDSTISTAEFKDDMAGADLAAAAIRSALYGEVTGPQGYLNPGDYYFYVPWDITPAMISMYGGQRNPDETPSWNGVAAFMIPEIANNYAKFTMVPVPGAVLLGIFGLCAAGVKLRKFS